MCDEEDNSEFDQRSNEFGSDHREREALGQKSNAFFYKLLGLYDLFRGSLALLPNSSHKI